MFIVLASRNGLTLNEVFRSEVEEVAEAHCGILPMGVDDYCIKELVDTTKKTIVIVSMLNEFDTEKTMDLIKSKNIKEGYFN